MVRLPLGEVPLGFADLVALLGERPPRLALDEQVRGRVVAGRRAVEDAVKAGRVTYGVNTGFGKLAQTVVPPSRLQALQLNLVRSHAAGVGPPLPRGVCRLAFALRLANLCRGHSGARPALIEHGLAVFNEGIVPVLPSQGSVGASGDLAPLAHMALVLIGEGRAWRGRRLVDGGVALRAAGLAPVRLHSKEGLALLNGTQVSTAILAEAVVVAWRLARTADVACALTLEAYKGTDAAFDARIGALRGHPGQCDAASNLRALLSGSRILPGHRDCDRVQDPYSLRCAPQVHGASRDLIARAQQVVEIEAHAVTDNPLVFEDGTIVSGGNFHAQPVAFAADGLKLALAELASISERRVELLVNPDLSGLPPFLARKGGEESGLMIAQVAAASLVSENKVLAHPASIDSIPTSGGKEDHVSMAPIAARQARAIAENTARVLAIELMAGTHALAFETRLAPGKGVGAARRLLRRVLRPLSRDRVLGDDIEAVTALVLDGSVAAAAARAAGELK